MKSLSTVSVTATSFINGLTAVLVVALVLTGVVLARRAVLVRRADEAAGGRSRPGRARLAGAVCAVLVCQLLTTGLAAAKVNTSMQFATTLGDVASLVAGSDTTGKTEVAAQTAAPTDVSTPASAWVATMSPADYGFQKTTFTGPLSGISQEVWVWTPKGYSPTDGKTYNVIVFLHGDPGTPEGTANALNAAATMQSAIDSGRLPPTILVIPSLNADDTQRTQPDCADIVGHAKVGTWIQAEVPAMVKATFPNVRTDREGWAIAGLSSGAFCSLWTGIHRSDVYGTVLAMSGYDVPVLGGLSSTDALKAKNTLSTLLAYQKHSSLKIWVLGAKDDPDAYSLAQKLPTVAPSTDTVQSQVVDSGGHSWTLWAAQWPNALTWWGTVLQQEASAASASPSASAQATATASGSAAVAAGSTTPSVGARIVDSFTSIRGVGLISLSVLAALALAAGAIAVPGRRGTVRDRAGTAPAPDKAAPSSAGRLTMRLTRGPARWYRHVRARFTALAHRLPVPAMWMASAALRTAVLVAACLVTALAVGLVANYLGDFYPSWSLAWSDLGKTLT